MRKPTAAVSLIKKGGHYSRLIVVLISLSKEQPWLPAWHSKYVFSCSPPLTCFPIHPFLLTLSSPLRIGIAQWIPLVAADWPAEWADWHPDNKLPLLQLPPQSPPSCPSPPRLWALSRHQLHDQVAAALSGCLYNKKTNMPTHTHLSSMIFFHTPPTLKSTGLSVTNLNKLLLLQRRLAQEKRESNANVLKRTILIYMRGRSSDPLLTCKYRDPEPLIATWFADYTEDIGIQSSRLIIQSGFQSSQVDIPFTLVKALLCLGGLKTRLDWALFIFCYWAFLPLPFYLLFCGSRLGSLCECDLWWTGDLSGVYFCLNRKRIQQNPTRESWHHSAPIKVIKAPQLIVLASFIGIHAHDWRSLSWANKGNMGQNSSPLD